MTANTSNTEKVEPCIIQAPMDTDIQLTLSESDAVHNVAIIDHAEQARSIDIYQFVVSVKLDEGVNIEDVIDDIRYIELIQDEGRVPQKLKSYL